MAVLYRIVNLLNGKCYVGQTIFSLSHRWNAHKSAARQGSKWRFHQAIRKYGPDVWEPRVIMESDDLDLIKRNEAIIIIEEKLIEHGYNSKPGGCGGDIVKKENREKWLSNLSESLSGKNNPRYNHDFNEETALRMMLDFYAVNGRFPSPPELRLVGVNYNIAVPKHFSKYRADMMKKIYTKAELITGCKYDPYWHQRNRGKKNAQD